MYSMAALVWATASPAWSTQRLATKAPDRRGKSNRHSGCHGDKASEPANPNDRRARHGFLQDANHPDQRMAMTSFRIMTSFGHRRGKICRSLRDQVHCNSWPGSKGGLGPAFASPGSTLKTLVLTTSCRSAPNWCSSPSSDVMTILLCACQRAGSGHVSLFVLRGRTTCEDHLADAQCMHEWRWHQGLRPGDHATVRANRSPLWPRMAIASISINQSSTHNASTGTSVMAGPCPAG